MGTSMKTVDLTLNEDQFYMSDLDSFCSESLQSCLVFQKEEGSNEWYHTRDEDLFQRGIFLFEWNCIPAIVRNEKMRTKEKKGKLVRGKREGVKNGK